VQRYRVVVNIEPRCNQGRLPSSSASLLHSAATGQVTALLCLV
jgi:hypothetical protein